MEISLSRKLSACVLSIALLIASGVLSSGDPVWGQTKPKPRPAAPRKSTVIPRQTPARKPVDPTQELFAGAAVRKLRIELSEDELGKLRENNREYVRCQITEVGGQKFTDVGVKLKGAAGSFREFDDRPALTLKMDRFEVEQTFHGLNKFHLNNSVQDETYLNELLCSHLFNAAQIPAPRITHARVWLNDRDVGLYVLKEGVDKPFLKARFQAGDGNLYDGGFAQDIDVDLEKDSGKGPKHHEDLQRLRDACAEPDPETRAQKIAEVLDVEKFIDFMAMELMTCHWDGYCFSRNNYRLYFHPRTNRALFLPHGMDQMFGEVHAPVLEIPGTIVTSAVMQHPAWRARYRQRLKDLLPLFAPADKLLQIVNQQERRLQPVMRKMGEEQAANFQQRIEELRNRLTERAVSLTEQVARPEPGPLTFDENALVTIEGWYGAAETEGANHEEVDEPDQGTVLKISGTDNGPCIASWRAKVLLSRGRYRFEAHAKVDAVETVADEKGSGVGLRISGVPRERGLQGDSDWTELHFDFEIPEETRDVELVAEIRAQKGTVHFQRGSLRIRRLGDVE